MTIALPPPTEPLVGSNGQISEVWYRYLDQVNSLLSDNHILIASGSLSGTAVNLTYIPQDFSYIYLRVAAASTDGTDEIFVRAGNPPDASSISGNATHYVNKNVTGTTWAEGAVASLAVATTIAAGEAAYINCYIFNYQAASGTIPLVQYSHVANAVPYFGLTYYQGIVPIQALRILGSAAGTFDAGTYALYGVR